MRARFLLSSLFLLAAAAFFSQQVSVAVGNARRLEDTRQGAGLIALEVDFDCVFGRRRGPFAQLLGGHAAGQ